jgi:hypothetical protein
MQLVLRCANVSRKGGSWSEHDYDLFDGNGGGAVVRDHGMLLPADFHA